MSKKSQKIQTRRNCKNKHNWEKQVAHALRVMNKKVYFKLKSRGE